MKKSNDVVFNILQQMLSASPEASYKRLNPALRSTLGDCINADLPFHRDTFQRIFNGLRGHWWFGDGAGSHVGEHYYSQACACNHASAIQSFEQFAGRPGVLWEENVATPERLHVGSQFTWKGYYVTVTSMRTDSLVACTYQDTDDRTYSGIKVGAELTDGGYRNRKHYVITASTKAGKGKVLRLMPTTANTGSRTIARRFTIRYDEIAEFRRTERKRLKLVLDKIATCNPEKDATALSKQIAGEHFRHFQLEEINAAFKKRKDWIATETRIESWRNGVNGAWLDVKENLLRINGDRVECSNGNSVSVAAVKRVLPILLDMLAERRFGSINLPLDGHTLNSINAKGAKVGCTFVAWPEIERLQTTLAK